MASLIPQLFPPFLETLPSQVNIFNLETSMISQFFNLFLISKASSDDFGNSLSPDHRLDVVKNIILDPS